MTSCFSTHQKLGSTDDLFEKQRLVEHQEPSALDEKREQSSPEPTTSAERGCKWFKWLKKQHANHQTRQQHEKIERLHAKIEDNRKRFDSAEALWKWTVAEAHLRQEAWAKGTDAPNFELFKYFRFSTKHRYRVEPRPAITACETGLVDDILDFRTAKGRETAVAWVENELKKVQDFKAKSFPVYSAFDVAYEKWLQADKAEAMSPLNVKVSWKHFPTWGSWPCIRIPS